VDDGSRDASVELLRQQFERRPDRTRVALLANNAGQHMAILAGFELARGAQVITLDAHLQNPLEEIARIVNALDHGADYVGETSTRIRATDQGRVLRGYARAVVDAVNRCHEVNTFVPALAYLFSRTPVAIEVEPRGASKHSLYRLIRLNFDLMTGFSLAPLEFFTISGIVLSLCSLLFVLFLAIRRLVHGPEAEGVFTLFGIMFFLFGVLLFGLGVVGEYVGRISAQVRGRPRYMIDHVLQPKPDADDELPVSLRAERAI
jgi:undecaprenyl-phosphate 4-deoxy-4-formamido-L-arabinose transferase